MATKKTAVTVPVIKHAQFTVKCKMTPREEAEFAEELGATIAQGYEVYSYSRQHNGVVVQIGKTEDWPVGEFLAEIKGLLEK